VSKASILIFILGFLNNYIVNKSVMNDIKYSDPQKFGNTQIFLHLH
jgi:hypothetical protein